MPAEDEYIVIGKITGLFGVRGWVKVFSYTSPKEGIGRYSSWHLGVQRMPLAVAEIKPHGGGIIASLEGIDQRELALAVLNQEIAVKQSQLEPLKDDEYYWYQLLGMQVINTSGVVLGTVKSLFATGSNDVLVVDDHGEDRLIPYIHNQYIKEIDLDAKAVRVDWQKDW